MRFGDFEINTFVEQKFKLDGGSMYGVIPRAMWQRMTPPDDNNLIDMHTNLFVLRAHGKNMIFDAGLGDSLSEREQKIYTAPGKTSIETGLAGLGLTPDDIDYVVLTHLHTDHAGGAVKIEDGRLVHRFKRAKYIVSKKELEAALNPDERTSAVYVPERYRVLADSGLMELIEVDTELLPGVRTVFTGGHTDGHFALEMESKGQKVFYYADIFCTSNHMPIPYVPAVDLFPNQTMAIKRKKLPEIISDGVIMAFDHDINIPFGRVRQDGRRIVVDKIESDAPAS